jgi:2-polyprenyl-6-hydroxyphenyl methylase/3-demethylubiquinone-9 3-methyltransferase
MEHITFNPIRFWRRIYELMQVDGIIYITTPNSLRLLAFLGALWRVLSFKGVGLNVREIFRHVTFGHHWKEYSAGELRRYFRALSPDFAVTISRMTYTAAENSPGVARLDPARRAIQFIGNHTGFFADQLEAIVRLKARTAWLLVPPEVG